MGTIRTWKRSDNKYVTQQKYISAESITTMLGTYMEWWTAANQMQLSDNKAVLSPSNKKRERRCTRSGLKIRKAIACKNVFWTRMQERLVLTGSGKNKIPNFR